jgi:hypothetical protein
MREVLKDLTDGQRADLAWMLDHITRTMDAIVDRGPGRPDPPA